MPTLRCNAKHSSTATHAAAAGSDLDTAGRQSVFVTHLPNAIARDVIVERESSKHSSLGVLKINGPHDIDSQPEFEYEFELEFELSMHVAGLEPHLEPGAAIGAPTGPASTSSSRK